MEEREEEKEANKGEMVEEEKGGRGVTGREGGG